MRSMARALGLVGLAIFFAGLVWFRYGGLSFAENAMSLSAMIVGIVLAITGAGAWKLVLSDARSKWRGRH
jgi:amino acid permease